MRPMIARWFERIRIGRSNSYLKVCLFICMLLSVASVKASSFTVNGVSYETISDTTCKVAAGDNAYEGMVNIPSEVSYNSVAYKVTAIGDKAFLNCNGLIDVTLPESLEEIGSEAFGNCYALTTIKIPDNLKRIDKTAFTGCNLHELYIGDCINQIGMIAFSVVPTVHLTSSISKLSDIAFEDADDLLNIYIPNSVKEIDANAFAFCGNLKGVYIDDLANWCEIKFGNQYANPTSKSGGLYVNGSYLTYLEVPAEVKSINDYAFYGCNSIYELKLSDSVEKIGSYAFKECRNLSTLRFGTGLRYIGSQAIEANSVYAIHTNDINCFCQIDVEDYIFNQFDSTDLFYNEKLVTKVKVEDGVDHVGKNIFRYYAKLASITMPNSVNHLGKSAFFMCRDLIKVVLSDSIKVIPRACFQGSYNLSSLHLPSELEEIEEYAFSSLAVEKLILPPSTKFIGERAFEWCKADTIILTDNIKELKDLTFSDCRNLKYIDLGNSMKKISSSCFDRCDELTSLNLPASMEYMGMSWSEYTNFKDLYCNSTKPYEAYFSQSLLQQTTLYVPQGCRDSFLLDYQWNGFKEIVEMDCLGGVDEINGEISPNAPIVIYDCSGRLVSDSMENLMKGIYIVKQGRFTKKIVVK